MNPRRPPRRARPLGRKILRCAICGEYVRNMHVHLIERHKVPLVKLGQGDYTREYHG